jgi:hypothetical protein
MKRPCEYKFRIDAYSPDSFPMGKLAAYMVDLAALLGSEERVHFQGLEKGSTVLVQRVEPEEAPSVEERLDKIRRGAAPPEAARAFAAIDDRLAKDNAVGALMSGTAEILHFPGRDRPKPLVYGPFYQEGTIEGEIIRVGGKDDTVPIWVQDGKAVIYCNASVEVSRKMVPHYRNGTVRLHGTGRWLRLGDGSWELERFTIRSIEPLDEAPLAEIVERLRAVGDNGWRAVDDPLGELDRLRNGEQ